MYGMFSYKTGWFLGQMLANIPYMEHVGLAIPFFVVFCLHFCGPTICSKVKVCETVKDQWSTKDNGAYEVPDDEVFGPGPMKIGLVTLELWPADSVEDGKMVSAAKEGDSVTLERLLQCPRDPNVTGWNEA